MNPHDWIAQLQRRLPFSAWPSWASEALAGVVLEAALLLVIPHVGYRIAVACLASLAYEGFLDPRGWNRRDVLQRLSGQALVELVRWLL